MRPRDSVIARQFWDGTIQSHILLRRMHLQRLMLRCQDRLLALHDRTSGIIQAFLASARPKDITKSIQVGPAIDKVSVKAVSSKISRGIHPVPIV